MGYAAHLGFRASICTPFYFYDLEIESATKLENHLKIFKISPTKYLPKFGGWCAYTMAKSGEKERVDPKSFLIIDDRLYLFYEYFFNDKKEKWLESEKDLRQQAEQNWRKINQ